MMCAKLPSLSKLDLKVTLGNNNVLFYHYSATKVLLTCTDKTVHYESN